eukprot:m.289214 g.289214  ORF g.289214 m.289214 type:complete len:1116 (-) comp19456_c0_seq11:114-3461(-)
MDPAELERQHRLQHERMVAAATTAHRQALAQARAQAQAQGQSRPSVLLAGNDVPHAALPLGGGRRFVLTPATTIRITTAQRSQQSPEPEPEPEPPTIKDAPVVSEVTSMSFCVTWTASEPIATGYRVDVRQPQATKAQSGGKGGGKKKGKTSTDKPNPSIVQHQAPLDARSWTAEGLAPGQEYEVSVVPFAGDLQGPPTPTATVTTLAVAPGPCGALELTGKTRTTLTVRWGVPPSTGGASITDYELAWDTGNPEEDDPTTLLYTGSERRYKVAGPLDTAHVYRFRIRGRNRIGWGPWSQSHAFTTAAGPPSRPSPPVVEHVGVESLTLAWGPPTETGGARIEEYTLEMNDHTNGFGFRACYCGPETSYTQTKLTRSTSYTFRLACKNTAGHRSQLSEDVSFTTSAAAPGAPRSLEAVTKATPTGFTVAWREADDGGAEILGYELQIDGGRDPLAAPPTVGGKGSKGAKARKAEGPQGGWTVAYFGSEPRFALEGLQPGTVYHLRVACKNVSGMSPFSDVVRVGTAPVVPSEPTEVAVKLPKRERATQLAVSWLPPRDLGGAAISLYRLEVSPDQVAWTSCYEGPDTQAMATNLTCGTSYSFRVSAKNRAGFGPLSAVAQGRTSAALPEAPVDVTATPTTAGILVAWQPGAANGAAVSGYRVEMASATVGNSSDFSQVASASELKATITSLPPAVSFWFRVAAVNSVGRGPFSQLVCGTTSARKPAAVNGLAAEATTSTSTTISWREPECNGAPILGYNVEVDGQVVLREVEGCVATIEGLSAGQTYRVRVQASNAAGSGPLCKALLLQTDAELPPPPVLKFSNATATSIRLAWDTPGAGVFKTIVEMRKGQKFSQVFGGKTETCKVSKLKADTWYEFRARCENSAGLGEFGSVSKFRTTALPLPAPEMPEVVVDDETRSATVLWLAANAATMQQFDCQFEFQARCPTSELDITVGELVAGNASDQEEEAEDQSTEGSERRVGQQGGDSAGSDETARSTLAQKVRVGEQFQAVYVGDATSLVLGQLPRGSAMEVRVRLKGRRPDCPLGTFGPVATVAMATERELERRRELAHQAALAAAAQAKAAQPSLLPYVLGAFAVAVIAVLLALALGAIPM